MTKHPAEMVRPLVFQSTWGSNLQQKNKIKLKKIKKNILDFGSLSSTHWELDWVLFSSEILISHLLLNPNM